MGVYTRAVRPLLFRCDPEWVHAKTIAAAAAAGRFRSARGLASWLGRVDDARLRVAVAGVTFPNPVGLAAGFDKNGRAVDFLPSIGFGSVEIGSVSADPSAGNPRPRLFRLPADEAIVVNYGVPNDGAAAVARRLARGRPDVPVGVNLVETNTGRAAEPDEVVGQFVRAAAAFVGECDYITLNLNCPNTTGGRSPFADPKQLAVLLGELGRLDGLPPVFLKVTLTADPVRIDAVLSAVDPHPFVAGFGYNVPPGTDYPLHTPAVRLPGSLCGAPLLPLTSAAVREWYRRIDRTRHRLIGVGGVRTAEDAYSLIRAGASLIQVYTALVYHGPGVVRRINEGLLRLLDRDGFADVTSAVGACDL